MGYPVRKSGNNEYCLIEHDSLKISNNKWCWHSRGVVGGSAIDFAMHFPVFNGRDQYEALDYLSKLMKSTPVRYTPAVTKPTTENNGDGQFILPQKTDNPSRVFAYLNSSRGIDRDIIWENINNGNIFQSKKTNNCVFVGRDIDGVPRYGTMRGTLSNKKFIMDCMGSDKSFGFVMSAKVETDTVYVFESPIEVMSHATIIKMDSGTHGSVDRLSLGCVSGRSLERYLDDNPHIKNVVLCLNNDKAGRDATVRIRNQLSGRANFSSELPTNKDFNDDLKQLLAPKRRMAI
jgi:hypothetical protein